MKEIRGERKMGRKREKEGEKERKEKEGERVIVERKMRLFLTID